jgi:hypothetical protein
MLLVVQHKLLKFIGCVKIADDFRSDVAMRDFMVVDGKILNQLLISLLKRFCGFAVIPDKAQMCSSSGNALKLLFGFGSVEPVECLSAYNQIDGIIFKIGGFRTAVNADEVCIFVAGILRQLCASVRWVLRRTRCCRAPETVLPTSPCRCRYLPPHRSASGRFRVAGWR